MEDRQIKQVWILQELVEYEYPQKWFDFDGEHDSEASAVAALHSFERSSRSWRGKETRVFRIITRYYVKGVGQ